MKNDTKMYIHIQLRFVFVIVINLTNVVVR